MTDFVKLVVVFVDLVALMELWTFSLKPGKMVVIKPGGVGIVIVKNHVVMEDVVCC